MNQHTVQSSITKSVISYPQNLVHDVLGTEYGSLPPDIGDSVEYLLETQMRERDAFILVLRYLRRMRVPEIAAYYGVSDRRIYQIINQSVHKLRRPSCSIYLQLRCAAIRRQAGRRLTTM